MPSICGSLLRYGSCLVLGVTLLAGRAEGAGNPIGGADSYWDNDRNECVVIAYVAYSNVSDPDWQHSVITVGPSDGWMVTMCTPTMDEPPICAGNASHIKKTGGGIPEYFNDLGMAKAHVRGTAQAHFPSLCQYKVAQYVFSHAPDLTAMGAWVEQYKLDHEGSCPPLNDLCDWVDTQDCDMDGTPDWQDTDDCNSEPEPECVPIDLDEDGETDCWDCDGDGECDCWQVDDEGECNCTCNPDTDPECECPCEAVELPDGDGTNPGPCWDTDCDGMCDCDDYNETSGECEDCESDYVWLGGSYNCYVLRDPETGEPGEECVCWEVSEETCDCTCSCSPEDPECDCETDGECEDGDCECSPLAIWQTRMEAMQAALYAKIGLEPLFGFNWSGGSFYGAAFQIPLPSGPVYVELPIVPSNLGAELAPLFAVFDGLRVYIRAMVLVLIVVKFIKTVFLVFRQY